MDRTVLNKYEISFQNKWLYNTLVKDMSSSSEFLDLLITDYRDINNAITLKNGITEIINGIKGKQVGISDSLLTVEMDADVTKIYDDPEYVSSDVPDFSIPTIDLKAIVELWIEFLQQ